MERPIRLDAAIWSVLERIARDDDVSVGQTIRETVNSDNRRRAVAKTAVRADERLVAPLRALLADDFAYARTWADLQARPLVKGCRLAEAGGGG